MGGPQHIVALALKTAWLCLRRSVEVRALTRGQITDEGIVWKAAKRQRGETTKVGLIQWSVELRATVDEALAIKRNKLAGAWYVFGNLSGQRYTKGGWKATLAKLMSECVAEAAKRQLPFAPFSLQDCRPKGVTDKMDQGAGDVVDATLHSSERMVRQVYDRRRVRVAKPVR
jgi:integrase